MESSVSEVRAGEISEGVRPTLVRGLPLLGSALPLLKNPHEFLKQAYRDYGDVFRFRAAHQEFVVLAGQEANRFVAGPGKDNFTVKGFWGEAFDYMDCPHGLVGVDGEIHRYQRKVMVPQFVHSAYRDKVGDLASPITDLISENARQKTLSVGPMFRQMISNQIGYNLQGHKTSYKKVEQMIYYFGSVMNVFGLRKWPKWMLKTPKVQIAKAIAKKHSKKTLALAEARTEQEKQENPHYLDAILPAMKAKPEWFSRGDMEMHALLPFVGALDTVASTMGFMLLRLLKDPTLKARIQHEVDTVFANGLPSVIDLRGMKDLNGLIKETMRLQPTAFGITRTAAKDFVFKGSEIKKGEGVLIFTTADHTNSTYFPGPERFDIERNSSERNEFKQPAFSPFGKGPHTCLGASLAEIMMPLNMGLLLHRVDIKPACDLKKVQVTCNPAPVLTNNFKVRMSLR